MTPRVLFHELVRRLPVLGPFLRRIDTLECFVVMHEAELDLFRAQRATDEKAVESRGPVTR